MVRMVDNFIWTEQGGLAAPNRDTTAGELICDVAEAWAKQALQRGASQQDPTKYVCSLTATEAAYLQQIAHTAVFGSDSKL